MKRDIWSLLSKRFLHAELLSRPNESYLRVRFEDGSESNFHGVWLRDHCTCPACHHPITKQRLLDTFNIPIDIKPSKTAIVQNCLKVVWPDGHESIFDPHWLHQNSYYPRNSVIKKRCEIMN